jgi:kumamolisin
MSNINTTWIMDISITEDEMSQIKKLCEDNSLVYNQLNYRHLKVIGDRIFLLNILNDHPLKHKVYIMGLEEKPANYRPNLVYNISSIVIPGAGPYYPTDLAQIYNFPISSGSGQKIGIIFLNGRYKIADMIEWMDGFGFAVPTINDRYINDATPLVNPPNIGGDTEITLDMQVIMCLCPSAQYNIYFTNTTSDMDYYDSLNQAIIDGCNIISTSWGDVETSADTVNFNFNTLIIEASQNNVNIFVATGDNGSTDKNFGNSIQNPACSAGCVAISGTLVLNESLTRVSETVWNNGQYDNATGAGISKIIIKPEYQKNITGYGGYRLVGDMSGFASEVNGYWYYYNGSYQTVGGTSATAPLYAALFSRISSLISPKVLPYINPVLYNSNVEGLFYDVTEGNNGFFKAKIGYDVCTGLGVIDGTKALEVFQNL